MSRECPRSVRDTFLTLRDTPGTLFGHSGARGAEGNRRHPVGHSLGHPPFSGTLPGTLQGHLRRARETPVAGWRDRKTSGSKSRVEKRVDEPQGPSDPKSRRIQKRASRKHFFRSLRATKSEKESRSGPFNQKNPRVRKNCLSAILGPENGCANFMGAWKRCVSFGRKKPMSIKIPPFMGGWGGGECRFYFYGREDFSDILTHAGAPKGRKIGAARKVSKNDFRRVFDVFLPCAKNVEKYF